MRYEKKKDKWVIEKNGVYFSLTEAEMLMMRMFIDEILGNSGASVMAEIDSLTVWSDHGYIKKSEVMDIIRNNGSEPSYSQSKVEELLERQRNACADAYIDCNQHAGRMPISAIQNAKISID